MPRSHILAALLTSLTLLLLGCSERQGGERAPLVLAASSMQEALTGAASAWAGQGHPRPVLSFAASSALARQIESGAEADLFVSADQEWMDRVAQGGHILRGSRRNLAGNELVLLVPAGSPVRSITLQRTALGPILGGGRLAMADPDSVPAGKYGKAALQKLKLWDGVEQRIARAENVRAALALVEHGDAPLGVVYATDARASRKVRVAARFPADTHAPIIYPIALLPAAGSEAQGFYRFLLSPQGQAILAAHGFTAPARG